MPLNPTRNDLSKPTREKIVKLLNARLADAVDLQTQCKQAHWNVKGPSFISLHELFDKVYDSVEEATDLIAERAVQLGGTAVGTARAAAKASTLKEYPHDLADGADHVAALADRLAAFGAAVRRAIEEATKLEDADTADVFTEISREADKQLWFVEAHAQRSR